MGYDIESVNLEAHVTLCQERYLALERRFENIEQRIEKIEQLLEKIDRKIHALDQKTQNKWDKTQTAIIGGLIGLVTYLVARLFF